MNILQHFRQEEAGTVKSLTEQCERAEQMYASVLTNFLDPREQYILSVVVKQYDTLQVHFFGGDATAERQRAIIAPDYYVPDRLDYEIALIEVQYPEKFVTLTHRNLLGAIMSTGIEREQLGDIRINGRIQFVVTRTMVSFLQLELTQIKRAAIKLSEVPFEEMIDSGEQYAAHQATAASLRLDTIVSQMINKSRAISQKLIEKEHVKVNHTVVTKTSYSLEEDDLLSIKGYGRAKLTHIGDRTKKDKIRINYETLFK